jgi:uncharacterized protein
MLLLPQHSSPFCLHVALLFLPQRLILRPVEDSDNEEVEAVDGRNEAGQGHDASHGHLEEEEEEDDNDDDEDDSVGSSAASSSDEGESAAAAHAAAIGNSPQLVSQRMMRESQNLNSSENKTNVGGQNGASPSERMNGEEAVVETGVPAVPDEPSPTKDMDVETAAIKKIRYYCPYNLNERDPDENTPIHVAIHARHLEHVRILLQAGASVHKKSDGSSPIHAAISIGSLPQHAEFALECVELLAEYDADLAAKDDSLHSPLYLACMYNLPNIVSFLLSTATGKSTLNAKADRSQGRALHVAAKFNPAITILPKSTTTTSHGRAANTHHPDGSITNAMHHIPGYPGKQADRHLQPTPSPGVIHETPMQILLRTQGIEIDAENSVGQTPLHIACSRGNWNAVRVLLEAGANPDLADLRGFTPGQVAHKRGLVIPNDLLETLGGPPSSGVVPPPRDLIVDPDSSTLLITHELCILHRTCPPIRRNASDEPPPENVRRLQVLVDKDTGILRAGEFSKCDWQGEARRAALVDVLKVNILC